MSNEIYTGLRNIFNNRFKINLEEKDRADFNKHLLGMEWGFEPRDLLYIFFDIEREFKICIPEEAIESGNFGTISSIAETISAEIAG